jgi:hypothetical protein
MIRDGGGARSTRVVVAVVFVVVVGCSTRVLWCLVLSTHAIHGYPGIISISAVALYKTGKNDGTFIERCVPRASWSRVKPSV